MITNYLIENEYDKKSLTSPTKILSKIDNYLKPYFFRGLIDGDGCFSSKNRSYFSITGNIKQNWIDMEKLLNSLDIKYKLTRKERKTGNSSFIVISSKKDIIKLGDYIYGDYFDGMGLNRKYKVYYEIKNKPISKYSRVK
jgi:intein/homing endonuclease